MVLVLLHLLGPVRFRKPSTFEPITAGPATHAESSSYPLPSTIAGMIASYAFFKGICRPTKGQPSDWRSVETCVEVALKELSVNLGDEWALRTGFVISRATNNYNVYVYLETPDKYVRLTEIIKIFSKDQLLIRYLDALKLYTEGMSTEAERIIYEIRVRVDKALNKEIARTPKFIKRVGISLERSAKVTKHGFIYSASDLDLHASFEYPSEEPLIATEVVGASLLSDGGRQFPVRLAEGLPGIIKLSEEGIIDVIKEFTDVDTECFALIQLTPILLPKGLAPNEYEPLSLTSVMRRLLSGKCEVYLALSEIPNLTRSSVKVFVPGYSYAMDRYRSPQPAVIGNTVCIVKGNWNNAYRVYVEGAGDASKLGWGTLLPIPLPNDVCEEVKQILNGLEQLM